MPKSSTVPPSVSAPALRRLEQMWRIARDQCGVTDCVVSNYTGIPEATLRSWRHRGLRDDVPFWFADALIQCAGRDADRLLNVLARPLGHEVGARPEPEGDVSAATSRLAAHAGGAIATLITSLADRRIDDEERAAIADALRALDQDVEQLKADTSMRVVK